jgi:putative intracellular protease/amidase
MDVLLVSRGLGKQALMHDEEVLWLIRNQADSGRVVFSVCTGALLCGAPGISPRYDPSFTNRSGLCGLWSTLTPVIFATARVGQRVRLLVKAVERSLERNLTRGYRNREMVTEAQTTSCFAYP